METTLLTVTALCCAGALEVGRRAVVGRRLQHSMARWRGGSGAVAIPVRLGNGGSTQLADRRSSAIDSPSPWSVGEPAGAPGGHDRGLRHVS